MAVPQVPQLFCFWLRVLAESRKLIIVLCSVSGAMSLPSSGESDRSPDVTDSPIFQSLKPSGCSILSKIAHTQEEVPARSQACERGPDIVNTVRRGVQVLDLSSEPDVFQEVSSGGSLAVGFA
jgi:hypothetical protein